MGARLLYNEYRFAVLIIIEVYNPAALCVDLTGYSKEK